VKTKGKQQLGVSRYRTLPKHKSSVITVDIFIPAFNEEVCIHDLLHDLLRSNEDSWFQIHHIFVISDASQDRTDEIVQEVANTEPKVKLIQKPERKGKQDSINLAFASSQADVIVFLDADVRLGSQYSLSNLLQHFRHGKVGVVQGGLVRLPSGFSLNPVKRAAYFDWVLVDRLRRQKPLSQWSVDGRVMALSRHFYHHLVLPYSLADDQFLFYSCIQQGKRFVWARDAIFYYGPPRSLADLCHQWSRYFYYTERSRQYFGKELVDTEMGYSGLWRTILATVSQHPWAGITWLICYSLSKIEFRMQVNFKQYVQGLFWTKSITVKGNPDYVRTQTRR
jgi:cellulose synthase/poly-beta-1,6-N-acetylglucosamine synthase-like glycosyltransferase